MIDIDNMTLTDVLAFVGAFLGVCNFVLLLILDLTGR